MRRLETPLFWFTHPPSNKPLPPLWKIIKLDGVLVNACDIIQRKNVYEAAMSRGIHQLLEFNGLVLMDSGGFKFIKTNKINITPEILIQLYEKSRPDIGVVLDHPVTPHLSPRDVGKRVTQTLRNTRRMAELKRGEYELMPVIHGYDMRLRERYIKKLQHIGVFNIYGVGGIVPLLLPTLGGGGSIYDVVRIIAHTRWLLPDKLIHAFGVGTPLVMHIVFYAGADSFDSISWLKSAGYGYVFLPGSSQRSIKRIDKEERMVLEACECPACRKTGVEGLRRSYAARAIHNAYVCQKEVENMRRMVRENVYEEYVRQIIMKSRLARVLDYIDKLRSQKPLV
ncbi:MAG: tRNA-guanine transglycosylase [Nitrososphaerota archaeon]